LILSSGQLIIPPERKYAEIDENLLDITAILFGYVRRILYRYVPEAGRFQRHNGSNAWHRFLDLSF
jgi:hypothetical protein